MSSFDRVPCPKGSEVILWGAPKNGSPPRPLPFVAFQGQFRRVRQPQHEWLPDGLLRPINQPETPPQTARAQLSESRWHNPPFVNLVI